MDGVDLVRRLKADHPDLAVVVMTAYGTIESAVDAMRLLLDWTRERYGSIDGYAAELGIGEDHDGIMVLPDELPVGAPLAEHLPIADAVLQPKWYVEGETEVLGATMEETRAFAMKCLERRLKVIGLAPVA